MSYNAAQAQVMESTQVDEAVERILAYLEGLPAGTETTTYDAAQAAGAGALVTRNRRPDDEALLDIHCRLHNRAEQEGLVLDSSRYEGIILGKPFHVPYLVRHA